MNSAQRAAFIQLTRAAEKMADFLNSVDDETGESAVLATRWDAARNRYFELEEEAKQSRTAQQMARKGLGRKSTAGR